MLNIQVYLPLPAQIHFHIKPKTNPGVRPKYHVDAEEKSKLHQAVIDAIASQPTANDLNFLLVGRALLASTIYCPY